VSKGAARESMIEVIGRRTERMWGHRPTVVQTNLITDFVFKKEMPITVLLTHKASIYLVETFQTKPIPPTSQTPQRSK
jgi:hypothetical protein